MHLLSILAADSSGGGASTLFSFGFLLLIPVGMYFLLIRPQRRRQRAQQEMQSSLEVGDEVMTASGIYGFITGFEDDRVWIEIDDDVQIRVNRGFLQGKVDTGGAAAPASSTASSSNSSSAPAPKVTPTVKGRKPGASTDAETAPVDAERDRVERRGMTRRRLWASLLGCVGITVALLLLNIGLGNTPALGLDLQGGVSVVLAPEKGASSGDLLVIRDLIRSELENRGIAEPDVRVEGSNIIVDLPGVKDQREALDAVDVAGIVSLRPVLGCSAPNPSGSTTTTAGGSTTTTAPGATTTTTPGATTTTAAGAATTVTGATTTVAPAGFGRAAGRLDSYQRPQQTPTSGEPTTPTTVTGATTVAPVSTATPPTVPGAPSGTSTTLPASGPATATSQDGQTVLRALDGAQCLVGPSGGSGQVFSRDSAKVELTQQQGWTVVVGLSADGEAAWNALASECFNGTAACPTKQLAIVLDDVIQSYPVVREPVFTGDVSISGSFKESEARSLSRVLNRGAFPAKVNAQRVDTVSPTLGKDSLKASMFAGLVGVGLLVVVLLLFYRRLTLLIAMGMVVWGMLIYSIAVFISQTTNFALTLAGVTGIIVSIGMTVDSYVVYFERMKDEVLHGRTFRNSAGRSFRSTWKTILAANLVSLIAAAVLFVLSVGSVRGFALYLGVTTICDVIVLWFFTRPAVILMAETGRLDGHDPFGIGPMPEAVPPPAPASGGGGS